MLCFSLGYLKVFGKPFMCCLSGCIAFVSSLFLLLDTLAWMMVCVSDTSPCFLPISCLHTFSWPKGCAIPSGQMTPGLCLDQLFCCLRVMQNMLAFFSLDVYSLVCF